MNARSEKNEVALFEASLANDPTSIAKIIENQSAIVNARYVDSRNELTKNIAYYGYLTTKMVSFTAAAGSSLFMGHLLRQRNKGPFFLPLSIFIASVGVLSLGKFYLHYHSIDKTGWTPLHFAAAFHSFEMAEFLIDAGADETITANGKTYKDVAIMFKSIDLDSTTFIAKCEILIKNRRKLLMNTNDLLEQNVDLANRLVGSENLVNTLAEHSLNVLTVSNNQITRANKEIERLSSALNATFFQTSSSTSSSSTSSSKPVILSNGVHKP